MVVQRRGRAGAACHEGRHDEGFEYVEIIRGLEEVHSRQEETGDQEKAAFLIVQPEKRSESDVGAEVEAVELHRAVVPLHLVEQVQRAVAHLCAEVVS